MMFKILSIYFFLLLGMFSAYSQNSDFSASVNSQCPGNLFTLTADDNSMVSYNWTITEQGGASTNYNVNPVAFVLDNPGLYNVELTVSNGAGTNTTTENSFLEVFEEPTIDYMVTSAPYCAPAVVDFVSNSTAGSGTIISYQAFTDGTVYNTADFQHTYLSAGTYPVNVSIENSNFCVSSIDLDDIVVSVFPALSSPLNPNTICSGTSFNYSPTSTIPGSTFSWIRLPNPDIIEPVTNGTLNISETLTSTSPTNVSVSYEVTTTSPFGCATIETVVLTVQSLPVLTVDDANLCSGQTTTLTAIPSQGGGTYAWAPSGSSQTINVSSPGIYSVTYSIGSCGNRDSFPNN
jgi:PKD repeat protein